MRITCIANQKGGVGKTTTAVNLARSLVLKGERVLLGDLDPQANATLGLQGLAPAKEGGTWSSTTCPGLSLVSFPEVLRRRGGRQPTVALLREVLDELPGTSWMILDCPPRIDAWGVTGLEACQEVLVPVQSEFFAMQGLAQMLRIVEGVKSSRNPGLDVAGFLLTMVDWREQLHTDVVGEVKSHMHGKVFATQIPRDLKLAEASSHGKPIWEYDNSSPGALAYLQLAREIMGEEP
jgi:chromosome partitioning protein